MKIKKLLPPLIPSVAVSAVPRKGAEQGVAATVASTPEKKVPLKFSLEASDDPVDIRLSPTENTPLIFSASSKKRNATAITKRGSCI